ncbi:homoserine dehydrogenase [Nakamurella antarctica]|uniref:Homoserine dehydrogenase n=1 Tax=Nakamurella antarctica TaxID=1902245 RepID=A0A3G8ZLY7_9ACTN|nr:homoserine dehydrogenase [Nakamurella antarctica]AZI58168.1 homoserine dehydrogenase [Nakamurella antarctica]
MSAPPFDRTIRVGLLGCGVVGSEVLRLLTEQADEITARVGAPVLVAAVAVRSPHNYPAVDPSLLTTDSAALAADPTIDVVIEVMGGLEPARELLLTALNRGAGVVTANKALLAAHGPELYEAADASGANLYFEAAVAGAIPLIRPIRESLAGDRISRIMGIVNGTTNYILSAMDASGDSYDDALAEATRLGYAEADPTADVEGFDAASKAAILASLAFHTRVSVDDVHREGISQVSAAVIAAADEIGCTVKLLAICERVSDGSGERISARVHPVMLPRTHPLASVNGAYNAVYVEAEAAGKLMFYGPGAGGAPTASAVMGDLVTVARNKLVGGRGPRESAYADLPLQPIGDVPTMYHISMDVDDRAGVLAQVAKCFADHGVSISTVRQQGTGNDATLVVVTHTGVDSALAATVNELGEMTAVRKVNSVMRVANAE